MDDAICFCALHKVGALKILGAHLSKTVGDANKSRSRQKR
jgi:hypothetical protein